MEFSGGSQEAPPTLDQARSEFRSLLPRLVDQSSLELAAIGVTRRSGVLSAVNLSYFDLRSTTAPPEKPAAPVPVWLSEWVARLVHPLLDGVVQVWTRDEFGGSQPSAESMLQTVVSVEVQPRPVAEAVVIDGIALAGFTADSDEVMRRSVEFGEAYVFVQIPIELSSGTPHLTIH